MHIMYKCGHKVHQKVKNCRKFTLTTRNPFDVGVVSPTDNGEYLVLLSGNNRAEVDMDHDKLPDWVALGERPCRKFKAVSTDKLVSLWHGEIDICPNKCNEHISYKTLHPNAFLTYNLVNDDSNSCAVEVLDASVESDSQGNILSFTVKPISGEGTSLDSLANRIFNVNMVIDGLKIPKHVLKNE